MKNEMPKTYGEATAMGYIDHDCAWQRGYVSRKTDINTQPIQVAGGNRNGQLYIDIPSWRSTRFCYRQYLRKA